jgi:ribosomal protein S3
VGDYGGGQHEDYVSIPASKCGLVIGKGGETIKSINQVLKTSLTTLIVNILTT